MARDRTRYDRNRAYDKLVDEHDVFGSYVDFFVFCAALGYQKGIKEEDAHEGGEHELLWMYIENTELFEMITKSIAYQETEDPEIFEDRGRQLDIMAEYAAAGADRVVQELGSMEEDPVAEIGEYILEEGGDIEAISEPDMA